MPFELDAFIQDCHVALKGDDSQQSMRAIVARAVSDSGAVLKALGEPKRSTVVRLYQSELLTVLNVIWAPKMTFLPHNHTMWAVIGVYGGRENNIFWKRVSPKSQAIEAAGARSLGEGDVAILGPDVIHSVTNPIPRFTGAIHVYGGDFFSTKRSEWDPQTLAERECDVDRLAREMEEENKRWGYAERGPA